MKKSFSNVTIKNAELGQVEAIFARFDVIDHDGDVTAKSAFTDGAPVVISAYGHGSWNGALPIGKGVIGVEDDVAVMKGEFFLNTSHGRDAWETVKQLSEIGVQEWSYSLHDVDATKGTVDGRSVRILNKITVKEVSPVLVGAGIDTGTRSVKNAKMLASQTRELLRAAARERWADDDTWIWIEDFDPDASTVIVSIEDGDGTRLVQVSYSIADTTATLGDEETDVVRTVAYARKGKFSEQIDDALAVVDSLATRAAEVVALRAEKGKTISAETAARLIEVADRLKQVVDADPPTVQVDTIPDELAREYARFVALSQGVTTP
jgi:hypothetical protein